MSLFFIINNLHFAFGMVGAIVLVMASWLSVDAYRLQKSTPILLRSIGLSLCALGQILHSLNVNNDLLAYGASILFILGLLCILGSLLKTKELAVNAVVIIPAFSLSSHAIHSVLALLSISIAYFSWKQLQKEHNDTWKPFILSFFILALAFLLTIFTFNLSQTHFLSILEQIVELAGFVVLGYWVWQFMKLRINESIVMILVGMTFLLATVVTLAFSTILIGRVTTETSNNLLTDVRVLDFAVKRLEEEALAKTSLIAMEPEIIEALAKNDIGSLDQLAEKFLEKYKLGFLTLTTPEGNVLVRAHALSRRGDTEAGERAFEEALHSTSFVTIEDGAVEGLSIRSGAPLLQGNKIVGTVIAGFQLDNVFADNMKRLTGLEMFIYKDAVSVAGTAFASDGRTRLVGVNLDSDEKVRSVLSAGKTEVGSVDIFGQTFHSSYTPLTNSDGKVVGMLSAAKPQQDIVNIANATNRLTMITVLFILLGLISPIYAFAKKVSGEIGT